MVASGLEVSLTSIPPLTDIVVIFPFRIPLPNSTVSAAHNALVKCRAIPRTSEPPRRRYLYVNYLSVPMIAVLLLLATKAINGTVLRHGILGADGVQPINIMALFISLVRDQLMYLPSTSAHDPARNGRPTSPSLWMRLACYASSHSGLQGKAARLDRSCTFTSICSS